MAVQKSKSTLALMEQAIMILVFVFAAAVCMLIFVKADKMSQELVKRDMAVNRCQTVAETVKAVKGDWDRAAELLGGNVKENRFSLYYNYDWEAASELQAAYTLTVGIEETEGYLVKGRIVLVDAEGREVFGFPVYWQKEVSDE